jgi:hypothetical protein
MLRLESEMKSKLLVLLAVLGELACQAQSTTFTNLVVPSSVGPPRPSTSLTVKSGQLAKIVCANLSYSGQISIAIDANSFDYPWFDYTAGKQVGTLGAPSVAGPATITLVGAYGVPVFCTVELISPSEPLTPSSSVVIPSDSGGPVKIILESSTDLVTWTPALPGTYGNSTDKRFFRVRAERTP